MESPTLTRSHGPSWMTTNAIRGKRTRNGSGSDRLLKLAKRFQTVTNFLPFPLTFGPGFWYAEKRSNQPTKETNKKGIRKWTT